MPQIASYEDVKSGRKERRTGDGWSTPFLMPVPDERDAVNAYAFLVETASGQSIPTHFHEADQYQIVVYGGGVLGRHNLAINAVHFARRHTPYGPIICSEQGLGFLTLRAHEDPGAQYVDEPQVRAKLAAIPDRKPWQVTEMPKFQKVTSGAALHTFGQIRDERGLASHSASVAPHARLGAPDPSHSNGQYVVVMRGSLLHAGREYRALSLAFVKPQETPFELVAGAEGLDALVLQFPRSGTAGAKAAGEAQRQGMPGTRVWQCQLCAFMYDEAKGLPEEGIAPGTAWDAVPEDWICPDCSAAKSDFEMAQVS